MGPSSFPDLAAVQRAFQMAEHLPAREQGRLRIGILAADGVLVFTRPLHGRARVEFLTDLLEPLGFVESSPSASADRHDCDVLFRFEAGEEGAGTDLVKDSGGRWPPTARWTGEWM